MMPGLMCASSADCSAVLWVRTGGHPLMSRGFSRLESSSPVRPLLKITYTNEFPAGQVQISLTGS